MRLTLFLTVFYLAVLVCGKGARVTYEKIFLFYAYEIDQLNHDDKQSIGYRCTEVIDDEKGGCKDPAPDTTGDSPKPRPKYQRYGTSFNGMIDSVGDVLKNTWNSLSDADRATHKVLFDRAGQALDGVKYSRHYDHSRYIKDRLAADKPEIDVVAPEVGKDWKGDTLLYDFQLLETIKTNEEKLPDVRHKVQESLDSW
ncbi:hypothetical protein F5Y09DRAFT_343916 [Xylaria sp. FL1042]|nr:hypothetical protein F5Y09DRAFT_343916 [Xylaria sp. FL1042]